MEHMNINNDDINTNINNNLWSISNNLSSSPVIPDPSTPTFGTVNYIPDLSIIDSNFNFGSIIQYHTQTTMQVNTLPPSDDVSSRPKSWSLTSSIVDCPPSFPKSAYQQQEMQFNPNIPHHALQLSYKEATLAAAATQSVVSSSEDGLMPSMTSDSDLQQACTSPSSAFYMSYRHQLDPARLPRIHQQEHMAISLLPAFCDRVAAALDNFIWWQEFSPKGQDGQCYRNMDNALDAAALVLRPTDMAACRRVILEYMELDNLSTEEFAQRVQIHRQQLESLSLQFHELQGQQFDQLQQTVSSEFDLSEPLARINIGAASPSGTASYGSSQTPLDVVGSRQDHIVDYSALFAGLCSSDSESAGTSTSSRLDLTFQRSSTIISSKTAHGKAQTSRRLQHRGSVVRTIAQSRPIQPRQICIAPSSSSISSIVALEAGTASLTLGANSKSLALDTRPRKRYGCYKCNQSFDKQGTLDTHMYKHNPMNLKCDQCPHSSRRYQSAGILQRHQLQKHAKKFWCHHGACAQKPFEARGASLLRSHQDAEHPDIPVENRQPFRARPQAQKRSLA